MELLPPIKYIFEQLMDVPSLVLEWPLYILLFSELLSCIFKVEEIYRLISTQKIRELCTR